MILAGAVARVDLEPPWQVDVLRLRQLAEDAVGVPVYVAEVALDGMVAGRVSFAVATLDGELFVLVRLEENDRGRLAEEMILFSPGSLSFSPRWFDSGRLALIRIVGSTGARVPPFRTVEI